MTSRFYNRAAAGKQLAAQLTAYRNRSDVLVLALPRGGVPVAFEVACALHAPLDIMVVRKLGVPGEEELALGAIASGGVRVLNAGLVSMLRIPNAMIDEIAARERPELERRERLYRGNCPAYDIHGRTVVLVDDGVATGATMRAAIAAVKQQQPAHLVIAVPVAAAATYDEFTAQGDEVVCVLLPEMLYAVGFWYEDFRQTSDREIRDLLERAGHEQSSWLQTRDGR
jgi:putative phosphoribosyl transferase